MSYLNAMSRFEIILKTSRNIEKMIISMYYVNGTRIPASSNNLNSSQSDERSG